MMYVAEIGKGLFWSRYYVPEILHGRVVTQFKRNVETIVNFKQKREMAGRIEGCPYLHGYGITWLCFIGHSVKYTRIQVLSGLHIPVLNPNTEIYGLSTRIFSHSV